MSDLLEMSVVLVTPDRYETVRKAIRCLRAQTARDRLEIIIVAPSAQELELDETELKGFARWRVVEVGPIQSTGEAIARGVRRATAPLVAYAEEHAYPHPGWAEALIKAHRQSWAAVGCVLINANPATPISWADMFTGQGHWLEPLSTGPTHETPPHQTVYKSQILLDYGPELGAMLEVEPVLHDDLRARGYQLYLESAAKVNHLNVSRISSLACLKFYSARCYEAERARHGRWSVSRRLAHIAAAPLILGIRLKRALREMRRVRRHGKGQLHVLPSLLVALIADAAGKIASNAFGVGDARQKMTSFELSRYRHLAAHDRKLTTA